MRTIYLAEERQVSLPANASREAFQLTGLSITVPCHTGNPAAFVAYGDTDVFDLGTGMQSVVMVFERTGGLWKLAAAVNHTGSSGWPALCTQATPPTTPPVLAPASYTSDLARALTSAATGAAQTTTTASPFAVNDFLAAGTRYGPITPPWLSTVSSAGPSPPSRANPPAPGPPGPGAHNDPAGQAEREKGLQSLKAGVDAEVPAADRGAPDRALWATMKNGLRNLAPCDAGQLAAVVRNRLVHRHLPDWRRGGSGDDRVRSLVAGVGVVHRVRVGPPDTDAAAHT
jgi:hypothetical protein